MRVLLVGTGAYPIPPTGYGGVERTIAEFAQALTREGHEPVIVNRVGRGRPLDEYRFALALPDLLAKERYDVLHASTPVVANRLAFSGRAFVYTTHSRHWFDCHGPRERFGRFLERRAVRRAAATVALTERLASVLRESAGAQRAPRIEVIPLGVDAEKFHPSWPARTGRRALGIGIVAPMKRWELAARALKGSGITLTIVGPTPDRPYAERIRSAGDSVELTGEVDEKELIRHLAEHDFLLHPSRVEILAGVVLQAMASGLPVVAGEAVGSVVPEGEAGWTAPIGTSEEGLVGLMRERSVELANDAALRRRLGEQARRIAETRYSWRNVVARHIALYERVRSEYGERAGA
ncbi:MAG: glycosyltransferase family 4 protein [Thermoplasmata archaeon]|nr:glycosyltransferase family 4 protein [Thermoplasmata archaeon]